jgi:menaquinone-9 beta-reductase
MQQTKHYQVGIVGGGLAGLSLAIQCATAGYSVVLFEKNEYPHHKVCGEYISMESWNHLLQLGLPLNHWQLPKINQLTLTDVKGNLYQFPLPLGGFGISRYRLDEALFTIAVSKGVTVYTQTKVSSIEFFNNQFTIVANNSAYTTVIAIGSFGKRSNLDIQWKRPFAMKKFGKLQNYIGVKYHIRYKQSHNEIQLHNFKNGYCGMSKIEDDKTCLCYLTTAKNLLNAGNEIHKMEKQILMQNPQLQNIFSKAEFLYKQPLVISQVSFSKKSKIENHILLLGDASGLITPLCGNGMSMALHASKISFNLIDDFLQEKISRVQLEKNYQTQWHKHFWLRLQIGMLVQKLFGNNTTTSLFLQCMKAVPILSKWIIKATHGKSF